MNRRTFIILVAIIAVMSAILMANRQGFDRDEAPALLPGLGGQLNDVTRLTIKTAGNQTVATLNRGPKYWTVTERNDYRADVGKIRRNLIALADATIVEEKTADPMLYARLGVEDIANEAATGVELAIEGTSQSYRVIVGKTGVRGDQAYVRLPGSAASLLIAARLDLPTRTTDWLDAKILDIASSDIFRVTISHPDGETLEIEKPDREASSFILANLPADAKLAYATVADPIGSALADLSLEDVRPLTGFDIMAIEPVTARFETFDGLVITANIYTSEAQSLVSFDFSGNSALAGQSTASDQADSNEDPAHEPKQETAAQLTARLGDWLFILPSHKQDQLTRHLADLLE